MASLSDLIEQYVKSTMSSTDTVKLLRSCIAEKFNCSPSQVTYVISTRFTLERGYITQSKRGGSGYITITKIFGGDDYLDKLISDGIGEEISLTRATHICERMLSEDIIDDKQYSIINSVLSDKTLYYLKGEKDFMRSKILKAVIEALLKE